VTDFDILPSRYLAPAAQTLVAAAMADLAQRYGGSGDSAPLDPMEFDPPVGGFFIAWRNHEPVGCVGWRTHADNGDVAELKRMYVTPPSRGTGVAVALIRAVEESALQSGRGRMILECGNRQPEAIALYEKMGYVRIPDFGYYRDEPGVLSYGRDLQPAPA
jgi:GNAT superfamily N-acetyltransferase